MALLFLGDFYYGYSEIKEDILKMSKIFRKNDIRVILNLEGPITQADTPINKRGEHLRQSDLTIEVLKLLNVVGVSLANNHIMDFGESGLRDTIEILNRNGIQFSGAGLSLNDANRPMIIHDQDKEYCIYCMTDSYEEAVMATEKDCGCAPIIIRDIDPNYKSNNNTVISFLHTGFEYNTLPMPRNINKAKQLIDCGFDYVIGSHPHLVQPKMKYKNGNIYFSIGNFYFSEFRSEFEEKLIKNKNPGFCNLGYGIFVDEKVESIRVTYCLETNVTHVCMDNTIDEVEIHNNKLMYIIQCWINRNNHNPILLGNDVIDNLLLAVLNFLYFVYGLLRRIS